jgi:rhodanese-related sulfurtransferase
MPMRNYQSRKILLALWLVLSFSLNARAGHEEDWIDTIAADRLNNLMTSGAKLFLVDLRSTKEFDEGRLRGAQSIPSTTLAARFREIPKTVRVVLYCACPHDEIVDKATFLKRQGYRNISVMPDGYEEWVKRDYPVDSIRR